MPLPRSHLVLLAAPLVLVGCGGGMQIQTDFDPGTDFAGLTTYDWLSPESVSDTRASTDDVDARIRRAVGARLAEQGYVQDPDAPQFLIGYHAQVEDRVSVETVTSPYASSAWAYDYYGLGAETVTSRNVDYYRQGTIVLDIVAADSGALIWRGTAEAEINVNDPPAVKSERVQEAVARLLERFPPEL